MNNNFKKKYLKYKIKYINLKKQLGGDHHHPPEILQQLQGQNALPIRPQVSRFKGSDQDGMHGMNLNTRPEDIDFYFFSNSKHHKDNLQGSGRYLTIYEAKQAALRMPLCLGFTWDNQNRLLGESKARTWFHSRLYREDIGDGNFIPINNNKPQYLFVKRDSRLENKEIVRKTRILLIIPNNNDIINNIKQLFLQDNVERIIGEIQFAMFLTYEQIKNINIGGNVQNVTENHILIFSNGIAIVDIIPNHQIRYSNAINNSCRAFLEHVSLNEENYQDKLFLCAGYIDQHGILDIEFGFGGREEEQDQGNLYRTAKRELMEESGLINEDQLTFDNNDFELKNDFIFRYGGEFNYNNHFKLYAAEYVDNN